MPRPNRTWIEEAPYHVFSRGSNRQAIFLNDVDFVDFEHLLRAAIRKHEISTFAWSLMPNHWHGLFRCPAEGLSRFMQHVNHRHALRFDRRWGRTGHVFQNRFGAVQQDSEAQLLWTLRYVVRNPVVAGICASPFDWRWTSFHATAGLVEAPDYLCVDEILAMFALSPDLARQRFVEYMVGSPAHAVTAPPHTHGLVMA
jgi:REP element-mobilizing transposase RayT